MREYKAVSPEQTISKISGILENIGIRVKEIVYGKPSICNSVRLVISDSKFEDLDIGTNGKGMSENYALASAYGEMMERIENKMLFFILNMLLQNSEKKEMNTKTFSLANCHSGTFPTRNI